MVKLTSWDKLIIAFVFSLSMLGLFANFTLEGKSTQRYAVVHVDHEQVVELSFSQQEEREFEVPFGPNGEHKATLEVKDGRVRMQPMSKELCPRSICSHTGWIERSYETIVCVPNRIVVSFQDEAQEGPENEVDGVTY